MERVTGIGGVFIKAKDPLALREWYREHLGIDVQAWGGTTFHWGTDAQPSPDGATVWSVFDASSDYFSPSTSTYMINYRVADLDALLAALRAEGCEVIEAPRPAGSEGPEASADSDEPTAGVTTEYGKFGWVMDPEGNKIELWEPPPGRVPD